MNEICFVLAMVTKDGLVGWLVMHPKMGLTVHLDNGKLRKKNIVLTTT